jgi:hypothetical protein
MLENEANNMYYRGLKVEIENILLEIDAELKK